jgi:hypothetical protein
MYECSVANYRAVIGRHEDTWVYVCSIGIIFVVFVPKLSMDDKINFFGRVKNIGFLVFSVMAWLCSFVLSNKYNIMVFM